jgi:3-oxoacyl-(acyl-carrier-protein) synthase
MNKPIAIVSFSSVSALGNSPLAIWQAYKNEHTYIQKKHIGNQEIWVASLPETTQKAIHEFQQSDSKYKNLDASVLFAMYVSRQVFEQTNWSTDSIFGINIGSSRGATQLFEHYHSEFIETHKVSTLASPTTTLGNISSWVAHDLQSNGPEISHSITCSTSLHAILNAIAWMQAEMVDKFIVGGSEAPLTAFTLAQMQALSIYSKQTDNYPCKAFDLEKTQNTMVIGEGASVIALETGTTEKALAYITGFGYATDILEHSISISTEAICFQKSMKMALKEVNLSDVDCIIMHAPGTIKGDLSEFNAIKKVFGEKHPFLTTNKWKLGHTFGASGALNIELALLQLQYQEYITNPFFIQEIPNRPINNILINAVGFGGNAVSILISK